MKVKYSMFVYTCLGDGLLLGLFLSSDIASIVSVHRNTYLSLLCPVMSVAKVPWFTDSKFFSFFFLIKPTVNGGKAVVL